MAQFIGIGTITSDIVRKETRSGVLATFRLAAGQRGHGQVWIDVEAWGNLAGTIHHHGQCGRSVIVAGRLTLKTWRDRSTGASTSRYVITAEDIDLLPEDRAASNGIHCSNAVILAGVVDSAPTTRPAGTGHVSGFRLSSGRAGSKSGRLWIDVELWHTGTANVEVAQRDFVAVGGRLAYGGQPDANGMRASRYYINGRELHRLPTSRTSTLADTKHPL